MQKRTEARPMEFGDNVATRMSQRTLVLFLITAAAIGAAYADLKTDSKKNDRAIEALNRTVETLYASRQTDRELLVKVAVGVESLQRQADRNERRDSRSSGTSSLNRQ